MAKRATWAGWKLEKAHKFGASPTIYDGVKYASKKEAKRAGELDLLRKGGAVAFYLRQVRFPVRPARRNERDEQVDGGEVYVCDFLVFWTDGSVTVEDTKGKRTQEYLRKKKLIAAQYPFEITEL